MISNGMVLCHQHTPRHECGFVVGLTQAAGIAEGLIRLAVGIEGTEDLLADFDQALDRLRPDASTIANGHALSDLQLI